MSPSLAVAVCEQQSIGRAEGHTDEDTATRQSDGQTDNHTGARQSDGGSVVRQIAVM